MNISISNIGWSYESDHKVYDIMKEYGLTGLEIAPTRIFAVNPYNDLEAARRWRNELYSQYEFVIPSMQSIWYGRSEKIFGTEGERKTLISYTKRAIDFAEVIGCKNLVFGCPRNRSISETGDANIAIEFFREIGDYAFLHHTVIAMEANPPIYNTNFINKTSEAIELIEKVDSKGFLLNLDVGTMIENEEDMDVVKDKLHLVNHVHISEPGLKPIQKREIHNELAEMLKIVRYEGFVSIEVGKQERIDELEKMIQYVKNIFG